jgi:hypothetical protein
MQILVNTIGAILTLTETCAMRDGWKWKTIPQIGGA